MAESILNDLRKMESYDNEKAQGLLEKLCQFYFKYKTDEERCNFGDTLVKNGGAALLVQIFIKFSNMGFFNSNSVWFPAYYTLSTIWNFSDASLAFAHEIGKEGLLHYLIAILEHEPYKEKLNQKNVYYLVKASLCILHNAAKVPENRQLLRQENCLQKVSYYMKVEDELLKAVSIMLLGYIVDESEASLIMDESGAIDIMLKLLQGALNSQNRRCRGYRCEEIAEGLALIATCEANKVKIYEAGAVPMLIECLEEGSTTEKMYAAKVIWQLAFDESLREKLEENDKLMKLLDTLSTDSDRLLSIAASGAKWVIEKQAEENKMLNIGNTGKHIMISYQWDNQKTMVEVKKRLQNAGLNVWMDVEKMAGSTLQAMAEAVEHAYIVIMCISAKYKESPSCRTEAEYSFELRKDIIPLMMDKNYKPDGWLGAILGAKLYIDFSKHANFEDSIHRLKKELGNHVPSSGDAVDGPAVASTTKQENGNANDSDVFLWTKEDVEKWLKENQLDFCLNLFTEYDGPLICQLQQLRREAPSFFFKSLRREMGFNSMTELLQFANALEKLNI